ncbi:MAG: penicillin-binding transpeptidase domain-containing protein [Calditerrivibrio sp.]|nr:penicillin-binding transpeptidase domain-containing protein [Calditerrivibrio sp.]
MIFLDMYGKKFFEKTVIYSGDLSLADIDDISMKFLMHRCQQTKKTNPFYSYLFGLNGDSLNKIFWGCLPKSFDNSFVEYAFYNYIFKNADLKMLGKTILNRLQYDNMTYGLQGLSRKIFGRDYSNLNHSEKLYLFYLFDRAEQSMKFEEYKQAVYKIYDKSRLNFSSEKRIDDFPHVSQIVLKELTEMGFAVLPHETIVETSFDSRLYVKVIDTLISYFDKKDSALQSAGIIVNAKTGEILTIFGSKNGNGRLNRSLHLRRQIGSVYKPVVYIAAFEKGISPLDIIEDKPTVYGKGKNAYAPKNFEDFYMGKTKVENALIYSLNNGTLQVALKTGLDNVAKMSEKLGLPAKPLLGFCLGSGEYNVIEVANYISVIANDGVKKRIGFVKSLKNKDDNSSIFVSESEERVFSNSTAEIIRKILEKVVRIGTAKGAGLMKGTFGKTGTTNDSRDVWFASGFGDYVIVVWIGRDDYKPMGEKATGGGLAAPLVAKLQRVVLER